jgi:hypothetical protein
MGAEKMEIDLNAQFRDLADPLIPLLRLEGLAIGLAAIGIYAMTGQGWLLFGMLILMPDLAMAGYLFGNRIGAICYNCTALLHNSRLRRDFPFPL